MASDDSGSKYLLLDELAEEYAARFRRGERPTLQEYADRFPELADDIRNLFPAMAEMEEAKGDNHPAESPDPEQPLLDRIGDFRIVREIGRGGMGIVYEAEQMSLGRRVALKVLPRGGPLSPRLKYRFEREARAAARLHHTNIVPVFGVGEHEGVPYIAMQYIQGQGLDTVIAELVRMQKRSPLAPGQETAADSPKWLAHSAAAVARSLLSGKFEAEAADGDHDDAWAAASPTVVRPSSLLEAPAAEPQPAEVKSPSSSSLFGSGSGGGQSGRQNYWRRVAALGAQMADGLAYAHAKGILHRDIKPSNLLLDTRGTLWIADFGLAKVEGQQNLTHTGDIVGTLRYMPPEAFNGKTDARSDVYSAGLTLYELLTLRPAFVGSDRLELVSKISRDEPARPRSCDRRVPADLETIVLKAIEKDPDRRYQNAAELADDLRRFAADEPIKARRMTRVERVKRWCRHHKAVTALSLLLLAVLATTAVGGVLAAAHFARLAAREAASRRDAEQARTDAETSYRQARQAVDDNLNRISESPLLRGVGLQPLRKELLGLALQYYLGFLARHGDDPSLQNDLADVFARTARITAEIGSREEALRLQEKGAGMRRALHQQDPYDKEVTLRLADDDLALSALRRQAGDVAGARRAYQDAYGLLTGLSPQNPKARGQFGLATGTFVVGIKVHASSNPEILRRFADTLLEASAVEAAAGERLRSATRLIESLYARRNLVTEHAGHPQHVRFRQGLASGWLRQGKMTGDLGQIEEALAAYEEARSLFEELVREHPPELDSSSLRHDLAETFADIGALKARIGRTREAVAAYEKALAARRKLAEENPAVAEFQAELVQTYLGLGEARARAGDGAAALASLREGLERQKALPGNNREPSRVRGLARYHLALARVYRSLGRHAEALASSRAAARTLEGGGTAAAEDWYLLALARAGCTASSDLAASAAAAPGAWTFAPAAVLAARANELYLTAAALRRAAGAGFSDLQRLAAAEELEPLRARADYRELVAGISRKRTNDLWAAGLDAAKARAAREGKDLLLYFCGSDWDGMDQALREKYLDGSSNRALAREWIAVEVDNPKYGAKTDKHALSQELIRRFRVVAWPSIVLTDSGGRPYARLVEDELGNEDWAPEVFVARLHALRECRVRRDALLARAADCEGVQRAAALDRALAALPPEFVGEYADAVREIVRLDAADTFGLRSKYLYATADHYLFGGSPPGAAAARARSKGELMTPLPEGEVRRFESAVWRPEVAWPGRHPVAYTAEPCGAVTVREVTGGGGISRAAAGAAVGSSAALLRSPPEADPVFCFGHSGELWGLATSQDGLRLVTGGFDGTVRLWDRQTGKELRRWEVPNREWVQVAVSPDGKFAACGAADGVARVFDLSSDRPPVALSGHTGPVRAVAFAADSRRLVTGGDDATLRLWGAATGRELRQYKAPAGRVVRVAVSPDGRHLLACQANGITGLWDFETGRLVRQVQVVDGIVGRYVGAFTPDGRQFLTGTTHALALWQTDSGRQVLSFDTPFDVCGLAVAPDGRHVVASGTDGVFRVYPLDEDAARAAKLMHTGPLGQALEAWDKVTAREADEPGAYLARARLYARQDRWDEAVADIARAARLAPFDPAVCADAGRVADVLLEELGTWTVCEPTGLRSSGGATLTRLADGSVLAGGPNAEREVYTVTARTCARGITAVRLEVLPDPSLPRYGPGRASEDGTFILTGFTAEAGGKRLDWSAAGASHSQDYYSIASLVSTGAGSWAILPLAGQAHGAVFTLRNPAGEGKEFEIRFQIRCESGMAGRNVGRFRLSFTTRPPEVALLENAGAYARNAWVRLAIARALRGEWREALSAADTPPADPSDAVWFRLIRSLAFDRLGEHDRAKRAYEKDAAGVAPRKEVAPLAAAAVAERIAREPENARLLVDRARCHSDLGRRADALADFRSARGRTTSPSLVPADAPLLLAAANEAARRGEWEHASADLGQAIELSGGSAYDWYRHALLRFYLGDAAGYRRDRATVLARFGQTAGDDAFYVAMTCELDPDADPGPALAVVEKLFKLYPQDHFTARLRGVAYLRAGRGEAAVDELTRAATLRKGAPVTRLLLAIAHHRAGHVAEARQWYLKAQQVLDLAQQNPDATAEGADFIWNRLSWSERLNMQIVRREAETTLGKSTAVKK